MRTSPLVRCSRVLHLVDSPKRLTHHHCVTAFGGRNFDLLFFCMALDRVNVDGSLIFAGS